jgi:DNA-binding transcriptional MerR regulator
MLRISDFARIGQVSMSALRYYDEIGLLQPVRVDEETGYRYYELDQLSRLHRILALKEVGFELAQIIQILDQEISPETIEKMLRVKRAELQRHIQEEQAQLEHIEARLKSLARGERMPPYEVVLKSVKPLTVLSTRDVMINFAQKIEYADGLLDLLQQRKVKPTGPVLYLYYENEYTSMDIDVEVAVPVEHGSARTLEEYRGERIMLRELPAEASMATTLFSGNPYMIEGAYLALGAWIESNAYTITGVCRKLILRRDGGLDNSLIEIQFPVEKVR